MAFDNSFTAVTGATLAAGDWNTAVKGNWTASWVGTTAGDIDYYSSATAKSRLALGAAHTFLKSEGGSAPLYGALVYRRQGGDAANWQTPGTTSRTPTKTLIQAGVVNVTVTSGAGNVTITYPVAFTNRPLILGPIINASGGSYSITYANDSTTQVTFYVTKLDGGNATVALNWCVIGD